MKGERKALVQFGENENKHVGFEQLSDIIAFRIVLENIEDCYRVLGLVHAKYKTIPGRFKDYISVPKNNNYQSLHTGIIGPLGQRIKYKFVQKKCMIFLKWVLGSLEL